MDNTTKITSGAIGLLAIIAIVMSSGLIGQENVYACESLNLAMQCPEGLSKINSDGIQTQCKFFSEELNRSTYKNCKTGWLPYDPKIEKELINITDKIYLVCQNKNRLINECQIINSNETIIKVGGI